MAACKHRVMDNCAKDHRPCIFSEKCFEPEEPNKRTNADCLRAMSDRELADALTKLPLCRDRRERSECERKGIKCNECLYEWLTDPAKES